MYPEHRHTGFFCVVEKTVNILFLIVIIALFVMSLCAYCDLDIYTYEQTKTIKPHNIVNYSILVLMFAAAALLLYDFLNKVTLKATKPRRIVNSCILICAAVVLAIGLCWICFDESAPRFDQATIYEEARKLAGYLDAPFDADYMSLFKRQRGYTLLMAAVLRIFGDRQIYIKFVNLLGSIAILIGICKMAERIVKEKTCIVFTVFALTVYYPLITYASFLYGTLLSLAFAVWGFYAVVRYCETAQKRYGVLAAFGFSLGILMHQSMAVAMIAGIIYLVVHINRENMLRVCSVIAAVICVLFLLTHFTDHIYESLTGGENKDSVPPLATIYMGLSSENPVGGPGSQDGSFVDIYYQNGSNGTETNKDAWKRISLIIQDYLTGERSWDFFVRKTQYQWLDPTMGARKLIVLNDISNGLPANSEHFRHFYASTFRTVVFKIANLFMILIYGFAAAAGIFTLFSGDDQEGKSSVHFLIQLYFIGGFAFQLLWETLSRYCFPYFLWLIPEAVYGVHRIYFFLKGKSYILR